MAPFACCQWLGGHEEEVGGGKEGVLRGAVTEDHSTFILSGSRGGLLPKHPQYKNLSIVHAVGVVMFCLVGRENMLIRNRSNRISETGPANLTSWRRRGNKNTTSEGHALTSA